MHTSQCSFYNSTAEAYWISPCEPGFHCENHLGQNSTCVANPGRSGPAQNSAYPGEYCESTNDCIKDVYCNQKKNVCVGHVKGDYCNHHGECDAGLRCQSYTCQSLLSVGDTGCTSDFDCYYGACNGGTCVKYFSVASGTDVKDCSYQHGLTDVSLICQSGVC
jgi:hypothetical protein